MVFVNKKLSFKTKVDIMNNKCWNCDNNAEYLGPIPNMTWEDSDPIHNFYLCEKCYLMMLRLDTISYSDWCTLVADSGDIWETPTDYEQDYEETTEHLEE